MAEFVVQNKTQLEKWNMVSISWDICHLQKFTLEITQIRNYSRISSSARMIFLKSRLTEKQLAYFHITVFFVFFKFR